MAKGIKEYEAEREKLEKDPDPLGHYQRDEEALVSFCPECLQPLEKCLCSH